MFPDPAQAASICSCVAGSPAVRAATASFTGRLDDAAASAETGASDEEAGEAGEEAGDPDEEAAESTVTVWICKTVVVTT